MTASCNPRKTTLRAALALASAGVIGLALAGCTPDEPATDVPGTTPAVKSAPPIPQGSLANPDDVPTGQKATAEIKDASGNVVGEATFVADAADGPVTVTVKVTGGSLAAGFHGMHIHEYGKCQAGSDGKAFSAAGGHLQVDGRTEHPASGDLISINILGDHTGETVTKTGAVKLSQIFGKSIIIHEKPDNFGNIPSRYQPPADEETMKTGDAGARVACGEIHESA